jgi:Mg-chelatase subunit ChlD
VSTSQLRIARIETRGLRPLDADLGALAAHHGRLQILIRRYLSGVAASLLAEPRPVGDGRSVDWYSDLAGQPVALLDLAPADQAAARRVLVQRLASLTKLADELPRLAPNQADAAPALRRAAVYPGDAYVYVIGDEPVVTFWGHAPLDAKGAVPRGALPVSTPRNRRRRLLWLWPAVLLALIGAGIGGWLWLEHAHEKALAADIDAAVAADCTPIEPLLALRDRLGELDPSAQRYPEMEARISAEIARCAAASKLGSDLAAAAGDCTRFAALAAGMAGQDLSRPPFPRLKARLDAELTLCGKAQGLNARIDAAQGDCGALRALDSGLAKAPTHAPPVQQARARLDEALKGCATAEHLTREIDANLGRCPELHRIDGEMGGLDAAYPPLRDVRTRLDQELELCARAARYEQQLSDAQSDCDALARLDTALKAEAADREPLLAVRKRLDAALLRCKSLEELKQAMKDAEGDCGKLTALTGQIEQRGARDPMYLDLRRQLASQLEVCTLADALDAKLAAAKGDCTALKGLAAELAGRPDTPPLRSVRHRLAEALEQCQRADDLARALAAAGSDCERLSALAGRIPSGAQANREIEELRARLDKALAPCRTPQPVQRIVQAGARELKDQGQPKAPKPARAVKDTRKLCPGQRPKEDAPDLVMVFDASGSMRLPINMDDATAARLFGGRPFHGLAGGLLDILIDQIPTTASGPSRIDAAKQASRSIVQSLPSDVDVGLVLIEDCPNARPIGFYSPGQRGALLGGINSIHPVRGTPLASGIERASAMVDGVQHPGVIVVISDGKESCKRDPCLTARQIARAKPMLTINVVDITGTGAGNCVAAATGGKVFTAKNAQQLNTMLRRATQEVRGPVECEH